VHPTLTPVLADGVEYLTCPQAADMPAQDLYMPVAHDTNDFANMAAMNIPRHGSRPNVAPQEWSVTSPLPGAVNVGFDDGHVQAVKLDSLWDLYWDVGYVPPAKRPGL